MARKITLPNTKPTLNRAKFDPGRRKAVDLRIGDRWGDGTVKELHELCSIRRTPHVHAVPNGDGGSPRCYEFGMFV